MVVTFENSRGSTAYKVECFAKARSKNNSSHTLLLYTAYDEQLQHFIEAAGTNTIEGLPENNVLKVAYLEDPLDQEQPISLVSALKETAHAYITWMKAWF